VKASVCANPSDLRVLEKPAKMMSISAVLIQIGFGFRSTQPPTFAQSPDIFSSSLSKRGFFGQKIHRHQIAFNHFDRCCHHSSSLFTDHHFFGCCHFSRQQLRWVLPQ